MKKLFLLLSILPFFVFCGVASAQGYTLLEPGVYNDQFSVINSETSFSDYLNLIFKIGIGIAAGLAVIQIVIGGIQYMASESPFKLGDAKSKIEGAILGLILALGIYIFLYTINPDLVSLNLNIAKTAPSATGGVVVTRGEITPTTESDSRLVAILKDEQNMRDRLKAIGVGINNPACQKVNQEKCTTVGLLPVFVVERLERLVSACGNCVVVVSGGTEWWSHTTHGPGKPVVDIRKNTALDKYVKSGDLGNVGKTTKKTYQKVFPIGGTGGKNVNFYDEDDLHYHVTFF